jgi:flagellar export protein FliJ
LHAEAAQLEAEVKAEQETARTDFEVSFGYARFARAALARRARLAQSITQVQTQIATATDALAEAFQEVKRYELAQEERERRDNEKLRHKENEMLDETASIGFRRRQRDEQETGR